MELGGVDHKILDLYCAGKRVGEIAKALGLSVGRVQARLERCKQVAGVATRPELKDWYRNAS